MWHRLGEEIGATLSAELAFSEDCGLDLHWLGINVGIGSHVANIFCE
jgi:hypothetical protein